MGRSTLELDPAPDLYFSYTFWPEMLLYSYYVNPMLSSKFNILSYNSVPSGQISIILLQAGVIFFADNQFECHQTYAIFKIECFVWLLHSKCSELKKIIYKQGLCFPDNRFGYQQSYVVFKIEYFVWLLHSKCSELKKIIYNQGLCFPDNPFGYQQPYVIFKLNVLSHNSVPSGQICNKSFTSRG